jgi:uncharacterized protein (DUF433 family)
MEISAYTIEHVRRLTGLSRRQIRYWDRTEFFSPTVVAVGRSAFRSLYTFRDVVGLRTIACLRQRLPLQELRRVGAWLRQHHNDPWSSLRLGLAGRTIVYFDTVASNFREAKRGEQEVFHVSIAEIADSVREDAARLRERTAEQIGKLERNRNVVHNAWVVAGTRIPVRAIVDLHGAGLTADEIVAEYPRLTRDDVKAALRRSVAAA